MLSEYQVPVTVPLKADLFDLFVPCAQVLMQDLQYLWSLDLHLNFLFELLLNLIYTLVYQALEWCSDYSLSDPCDQDLVLLLFLM